MSDASLEPRIPDAILAQLLAGADANMAFDRNGLIDDLRKALAEPVLNAEMGQISPARSLATRSKRPAYARRPATI